MVLAVVLIVVGGALWLWPAEATRTQVGPQLAALAPSSGSASTRAAAGPTSGAPPASRSGRLAEVPRSRTDLDRSSKADPAPMAAAAPHTAVAPMPGTTRITVTAPEPPPSNAVPAAITVPFASSHHPGGLQITVLPHGPDINGDVWIPGPEVGISNWSNEVSWLNSPGFSAPFSTHGAVIIAGHINWQGTPGALSDLSEYGRDDVGKTLEMTMTDGRTRSYRITQGFSIDKSQLADESPQGPLHTAIFGQTGTYGRPGYPTEELRLVSCGGQYDPAARSYTSNIVVIAQPST